MFVVCCSYIRFISVPTTAVLLQALSSLPQYYRQCCHIPAISAVFVIMFNPITAVQPRLPLYYRRLHPHAAV